MINYRGLSSFLLLTCLVYFMVFSLPLAAYSPPAGVLGPEEVDFGGQTVYLIGHTDYSSHFEEGSERESRIEKAEELFNVEIVNI